VDVLSKADLGIDDYLVGDHARWCALKPSARRLKSAAFLQ
jgi:hypothetical protein